MKKSYEGRALLDSFEYDNRPENKTKQELFDRYSLSQLVIHDYFEKKQFKYESSLFLIMIFHVHHIIITLQNINYVIEFIIILINIIL